jgi:hypothetical protein
MVRVIDFRDWVAADQPERERIVAIEASFATAYRRERVRDAEEADFLRRRGTPQHLIGPTADDHARRVFAAPPQQGVFRDIDLGLLDPDDPDERRLLIEAEHPELADALDRGDEVVRIDGDEINSRLHIAIHEIVAQQLWENEPPEAWLTAQRLLEAGHPRHEVFHMIGSALVPQFQQVLQEVTDRDAYVRALEALPDAAEIAAESRARPKSKRQLAFKARKAARRARARNRRKG